MAFHYKYSPVLAVDSIVSTIITELKDVGGWTAVDTGYNILKNPDSTFEVNVELDATKAYLRFKIGAVGMWSTVSHAVTGVNINLCQLIANKTSGIAGTENGLLFISYEDDHFIIGADYTANGADWRKSVYYGGEATPLKSTDFCLTAVSSMPSDSVCAPSNQDETGNFWVRILHDVGDNPTKPVYQTMLLQGANSEKINNVPKNFQIYAVKPDARYRMPMYLFSHSAFIAGGSGENAGVRCELKNIGCGGEKDAETHGQTIEMIDGKEYIYFINSVNTAYGSLPGRVIFRVD